MQNAPEMCVPEVSLMHRLNNQLSLIVGNCELVIEKLPDGSPLLKHMAVIRDAAKTLTAEIDGLRHQSSPRPMERRAV